MLVKGANGHASIRTHWSKLIFGLNERPMQIYWYQMPRYLLYIWNANVKCQTLSTIAETKYIHGYIISQKRHVRTKSWSHLESTAKNTLEWYVDHEACISDGCLIAEMSLGSVRLLRSQRCVCLIYTCAGSWGRDTIRRLIHKPDVRQQPILISGLTPALSGHCFRVAIPWWTIQREFCEYHVSFD